MADKNTIIPAELEHSRPTNQTSQFQSRACKFIARNKVCVFHLVHLCSLVSGGR